MIDLEQARDLLLRAVESQGRDFVYGDTQNAVGCYYVPLTSDNIDKYNLPVMNVPSKAKRTTGCLIGVALDLAGLSFHHRATSKLYAIQNVSDYITPEAVQYFQEAQNAQDSGNSWGEAYDAAELNVRKNSND